MTQATITTRTDWAKTGKVEYTVDGKKGAATFWKSDSFASLLTEGATVTLEFEKKPNKNKPDEMEVWIKSVNGQGGKAPGGGGGFRSQPKSREETHGPCIAGIIKECIAQGDSDMELAAKAIALYKAEIKEFAS